MRRLFSRLLLFLGLLLGIKGLGWWLYKQSEPQHIIGSPYKSARFDSLRTSCHAVFVGSSRTFMSIIPGRFDSLTGQALHSYNYGVGEFVAPHTFRLAESLLLRPDLSLRYLFLELSLPSQIPPQEPFLSNPFLELSYRARSIRPYEDLTGGPAHYAWANGYALALHSPTFFLRNSLNHALSLLRGQTHAARPKNANGLQYDFIPSSDGYLRDRRLRPAIWLADTALLPYSHQVAKRAYGMHPAEAPDARYLADITKLLRLADARKIHLMVYLPNRLMADEARLLPAVFNRIPAANRLQIYPDDRFDALFSPASSFNIGHLNHYGAIQYTTLLAEAFERACRAKNHSVNHAR